MERINMVVKLITALLLSSSFLIGKPHNTRNSGIIGTSGAVGSVLNRQEQEIVFKLSQAGSGKTKDGYRFSFTDWDGSGVWLSLLIEERRSPVRARMALRAILRGKELLEQGTKVNSRGQKVGERVVLKFHSKETKGDQHMIAWTNGPDFHYLQSSSLRTILAFERQMIKQGSDLPQFQHP